MASTTLEGCQSEFIEHVGKGNHQTFFNSCACSRRASNTVRMLAMFSFHVGSVTRTLDRLCSRVSLGDDAETMRARARD
jgi:hypothetical protein